MAIPDFSDLGVRCPGCRTGLLRPSAGIDPAAECAECRARYPFRDGFLDLLEIPEGLPSAAQALMQWPPLIRIYESRLWRRSPLLSALTGLSFEREYEIIAQAAGLEAHQRMLDLACGPGIYARRFARALPDAAVLGLDLSAPMLRYASRAASSQGLRNLLFLRGSAIDLPFEAARFDAINCCGALHLFPDVGRALAEIARTLAPAGRFTVATVRRGESRLAAHRARLRRRLSGIDAFTPAELAARLERAGLSQPRCLHAAGIWLIMSAGKPAESPR